MGITLKNLRPGVLILADARLRLGPGETAEVAAMTPQIQKAIAAGRLARLDEAEASGSQNADQAPPLAAEALAERSGGGDDTESAGRRTGQGGKRPPLDALRRKAEEKADVKGEEAAGGAG